MATIRISQLIGAGRKDRESRLKELTEYLRLAGKSDLFQGVIQSYEALRENVPVVPTQNRIVQMKWTTVVGVTRSLLSPLLDTLASLERGNQLAKADLVVKDEDGKDVVIIKDAPATLLLAIQKDLQHVRTMIEALPVLDPAFAWTYDPNQGLYVGNQIRKESTEKVQEPIVLYDATDKHPAQTQLITQDRIVGYKVQTPLSGSIPVDTKTQLSHRATALLAGVERALAEANTLKVEEVNISTAIFDFLFGGIKP